MPLPFVPARDLRHRTACFALYKALLRQVPNVPLPDSLVQAAGPVNPIKHIIRSSFRRNRKDTSPRLVVSALSNGYKFLYLLSRAYKEHTGEYKTVLDFLTRQQEERARRAQIAALRCGASAVLPQASSEPSSSTFPGPTSASSSTQLQKQPSRPASEPREPPTPLLKRIPNPHYVSGKKNTPKWIYESAERPRAQPNLGGTGIRHVPMLATTAAGYPFLRTKKPEPPALSPVLHRLARKREMRMELVMSLGTDDMWYAEAEDEWERLVAEEAGDAKGRQQQPLSLEDDRGVKFVDAVFKSIKDVGEDLDLERLDLVERSKALKRIVDGERELAKRELEEWRGRRRNELEPEGLELS